MSNDDAQSGPAKGTPDQPLPTGDKTESMTGMAAAIAGLPKRTKWVVELSALVVVIYGAVWWVHKSAQDAVLDEKFLATLAARIRPSCIFDSNGSVEADFGASEYIKDIIVTPQPKSYGYSITIKGKRPMVSAPLITGIDVSMMPQSATRGKMHDWTVIVAPNGGVPVILWDDASTTNSMGLHRFRLEILH